MTTNRPGGLTYGEFDYWFDNWSEGPFTLDEVAAQVLRNPRAASEFHTTGSRFTYSQYLEIQQTQVQGASGSHGRPVAAAS
jgi:hypothetical protein